MIDEYVSGRDDVNVLVLGHSHGPAVRSIANGKMFINSGSWRKMYYLDFGKHKEDFLLTYAQLDILDGKLLCADLNVSLNIWKGKNDLPFKPYS